MDETVANEKGAKDVKRISKREILFDDYQSSKPKLLVIGG
jgi:hypothetical protein